MIRRGQRPVNPLFIIEPLGLEALASHWHGFVRFKKFRSPGRSVMMTEMFQAPARALPLAFIPPCIPTWARHAPVGRDWVHEIKHDGYRLMVRRQGARVRLFTRRGFDWSHRFPLIVEAAGSLRVRSISIDGEAVVCGDDGVSRP